MADTRPPNSTLKPALTSLIVFVLLIALLALLPEVVKLIGTPFSFLPDWVGLAPRVRTDEVYAVPTGEYTTDFDVFLEAGRYAIFTNDLSLLAAQANTSDPWLVVLPEGSTESRPVQLVTRGVRFYDTILARGRPIFTFEILAAGRYAFSLDQRFSAPDSPQNFISAMKIGTSQVSLVPDYTSGRGFVLNLAYFLQLLPFIGPGTFRFIRRTWAKRKERRVAQKESRERYETFREALEEEPVKETS